MAMPPGIIEELDLLLPMLTNEFSILRRLNPLRRLNSDIKGRSQREPEGSKSHLSMVATSPGLLTKLRLMGLKSLYQMRLRRLPSR